MPSFPHYIFYMIIAGIHESFGIFNISISFYHLKEFTLISFLRLFPRIYSHRLEIMKMLSSLLKQYFFFSLYNLIALERPSKASFNNIGDNRYICLSPDCDGIFF